MGKGKSANSMSQSTKLVIFCALVALMMILWNTGVSKSYGPLGAPSVFDKELSEVEIDALPKSDFRSVNHFDYL